MKKKILLTGSGGFIGKNIKESYLSDKYELFSPRSFELDLIDTEAVDKYFEDKEFFAVLHSGCKPGHRNAKDLSNLFYSNVRIFENLERHKNKYKKFINFGSGAIYDMFTDVTNAREEDIYKKMGKDDHSFCKYVISKQIDNLDNFVDLNIFGIFGKHEDWEIRFISNAICKALYDLPITIRQNRRFSYLFVEDLMPILEYFIGNDAKHKSYNVAPDEKIDLVSIANLVKKISGKNVDIKVSKDGYGFDYTADNSRLKNEISKLEFTKLESAIQSLYNYYEKNIQNIDKNLLLTDK